MSPTTPMQESPIHWNESKTDMEVSLTPLSHHKSAEIATPKLLKHQSSKSPPEEHQATIKS